MAGTPRALIAVGNGIIGPVPPGCESTTTGGCTQELSGVIAGGSPIGPGTFTGTITVQNLEVTESAATVDVTGSVSVTEDTSGAQLTLAINGQAATSFIAEAFTFRGSYRITRGEGWLVGANGTGVVTFEGKAGLDTGVSTVSAFTLAGTITT